MKSKYILIDSENIHLDCSQQLIGDQFKILVFVGAKQPKVPVDIVTALQPLGKQVRYIAISGSGPNALDFHIAFYIGKISQSDPSATFLIVSNDKGFDPLIEHMTTCKLDVKRIQSPSTTLSTKAADCGAPKQRVQAAISFLQRCKENKPRTLKSLQNSLVSLFRKKLSEKDIKQLIKQLIANGHVTFSGERVAYILPNIKN